MAGPVQWPHYGNSNVGAGSGANGSGVLGKDQFLKILITQLQNQDPAAPMQDRDFIAQMAQFSSLEQMMNMTNELKGLRQSLGIASGMIGLEVVWMTYNANGQPVGEETGVVGAIIVQDGKQFAQVGSRLVDVDHIVAMKNPEVDAG